MKTNCDGIGCYIVRAVVVAVSVQKYCKAIKIISASKYRSCKKYTIQSFVKIMPI